MNKYQSKTRLLSILPGTLIMMLLLAVIAACEQPSQPATKSLATSATVTTTPTGISGVTATSTPNRPIADATFVAAKLTEIYIEDNFPAIKETAIAGTTTAIALTPTYTPAPILPTPTPGPPEPTPTMQIGLFECNPTAGFPYVEYSCWRGLENGRYIYVITGREKVGYYSDPGQGVILVFPPNPYQVYRTPLKIGAVQIASVSGTQFTLSGVDPATNATFIFNLATRQFETQSGTPIPTTPVPTPKPEL